jgi:DNA-binding NarL/FixJ family response regulator
MISSKAFIKTNIRKRRLQEKAMPLRLFILKEDPLVRYRLSASVSGSDDMVIVGEGAWTEETLGHLRAAQPDVLIFELFEESKVPGQIATLRDACGAAKTKLFAVSRGEGLSETLVAIDCGVEGLLKTGCTVAEIRSAILKLEQDGTYLCPAQAMAIVGLLDSSESRRKKALALQLTALEETVIRDLSEGLSNLEISDRHRVSERKVKACVGTLKNKFGVTQRLDIVLSAKNLALACAAKLQCWLAWAMPVWEEVVVII